jgi:hypothetical protein
MNNTVNRYQLLVDQSILAIDRGRSQLIDEQQFRKEIALTN